MTHFLEAQPTAENRWRALILLGRNTASYKFALGRALLSLTDRSDDLVVTDELRRLAEFKHQGDLIAETEARWRVVETGWELGVSAGLIEFQQETGGLFIRSPERRLALRLMPKHTQRLSEGRLLLLLRADQRRLRDGPG